LPLTLSLATKRQIARALGKRAAAQMTTDPLEIAPAVTLDIAALVGGDLAQRAERYGQAREDLIECNSEIMGGTPVIKGTRITVYAVLGRLAGSDTVEDILEDYPTLSREAVETAELYARTHPIIGRPGGRPWARTA
jgi:uncharacterized protein (DUF433 family)